MTWIFLVGLTPPPPSVVKPHDISLIFFLHSLCGRSPHSRSLLTDLKWQSRPRYMCSACVSTLLQASPSKKVAAASNTASTPPVLSLSQPTWRTPASHRPMGRRCAPPARLSPFPSPSWGSVARYGREVKSRRCPEICPARCQPNVPAPTRRECDFYYIYFFLSDDTFAQMLHLSASLWRLLCLNISIFLLL